MILAQHSIALQVLGSGGPELGDKRASSAYVVWIDGKSRILVDMGGGASLRFEEVGAKIKDLDVILLTHFHEDHTGDLLALVMGAFFTNASGNVYLFGPDGNQYMPNTEDFIKRLFGDQQGAWEYLGDNLDGRARLQFKPKTIKETHHIKRIYTQGNMSVDAISVHHGIIPAIAYRVNVGNKSITFSGDMNGNYHTLEKLAQNTDILVAHNAVPKGATSVSAQLHMTPNIIGQIAQKAHVQRLILSHRMLRTLGKEKETKREIRKSYKGSVKFANDRSYYKL